MANSKLTYLALFAISLSAPAYADNYSDYQMREQQIEIENNRQAQAIDMQNQQNQMNSMQAPQASYQPTPSYQPTTATSMYGTAYVGPGSGYYR